MATVSTYLNFQLQTEEAFNFYRSIFNPDAEPMFMRFSDTPIADQLPENERNGIMHGSLEIIGGHVLLATDMLESMGHEVRIGNNTTLNLTLDSRDDVDRIFAQLSEGATEIAEPREEAWGYWAVCLDKFGIRWMFNVTPGV